MTALRTHGDDRVEKDALPLLAHVDRLEKEKEEILGELVNLRTRLTALERIVGCERAEVPFHDRR